MSTASHITSDAIAPIDELFTDRRPTEGLGAGMATSSVVATNNVSPSIELWKGWIPRLIELCTCRQSCLNSMSLSCRLVISTEIVVFPACTCGASPHDKARRKSTVGWRRRPVCGSTFPRTTRPDRSL